MSLVIRPIERRQVAAVVRLDAPSGPSCSSGSKSSSTVLRSRPAAWTPSTSIRSGKTAAHCRHYRGKWFSLDSTVDEPTTRRIIVRVEQVFTAYRQVLPPRSASRRAFRV